jgi:hypothetical protein
VLLAIDPPTVLMVLGVGYVISGLAVTVLGRQQWRSRRNRRKARRNEAEDRDP